MKNKRFPAFIVAILITITTVYASPLNKKALQEKVAGMTKEQKETRTLEIKERVAEIKGIDKSSLTHEEKKALRHELKDMKKEAKAIGHGGVYISLVGILVIILVLIILL